MLSDIMKILGELPVVFELPLSLWFLWAVLTVLTFKVLQKEKKNSDEKINESFARKIVHNKDLEEAEKRLNEPEEEARHENIVKASAVYVVKNEKEETPVITVHKKKKKHKRKKKHRRFQKRK